MVEAEHRSLFWWITAAKRRKANAFREEPSQAAFRELVSPYHFYGTQGMDNLDRWLSDEIFTKHTPTDLNELIGIAIDEDTPQPLTEVPGFDWPKATEVLRAVAPDQYAILNPRALAGLGALGVSTEQFGSLSTAGYKRYRRKVEMASHEHGFIELLQPLEGNEIPTWATTYEVADCVFQYHFNRKIDLSDRAD